MHQTSLIPSSWQLPDEFKNRLGSTVGKQRLMQFDDQLLIVAHHVPNADENSRQGILFWRNGAGEWQCSNGDPGNVALHMHLDRYSAQLEDFDQQEEKAKLSDQYLPLLEGLAPLCRAIRNLLIVLEQARDAMPHDRAMIDHRDRAYDLSRQAELLYLDAKNSMDVAVVRRAEEQAIASHQMTISAHRLNIMAALFFPLATIGSILGTSLTDNWSWSKTIVPFALFLGLGVLTGVVLAIFISRPAKNYDHAR